MRTPYGIPEYSEEADRAGLDAIDFMKREECTYNPENGFFFFTDCYIKRGCPDGVAAKGLVLGQRKPGANSSV